MEFREYEPWTKAACVDIALNHSDTYYNVIAAYNKALNSRRSEDSSDGGKWAWLILCDYINKMIVLFAINDIKLSKSFN